MNPPTRVRDLTDEEVARLRTYIDANFRTLATRNSRGLLGDYIGGYGALRFGMAYPNIFSVVYAMHPVGTGSGVQMLVSRPNWSTIANAKSLNDLNSDGFTPIFASIFQAHLPNPANAPLYFDPPAHLINGKLVIDSAQMARLRDNLFIESLIRRDLNQQVKERVYQVAFVCLVLFAAVVIFNDITKLLPAHLKI